MKLQVFDNRDHPDRPAVNLRIVHPDGYTVAYGVLVGDDPRRVAESIAAEPLVLEYVPPTEEERAARRPEVCPVVYTEAGFTITGKDAANDWLANLKGCTLMFCLGRYERRWRVWGEHAGAWDEWRPLDQLADFRPVREGAEKPDPQRTLF